MPRPRRDQTRCGPVTAVRARRRAARAAPGGEPVAFVFWMHDYAERGQTGWFISRLEDDGEPVGQEEPRRLQVTPGVDGLIADRGLDRAAWLAQAQTIELVTAQDALRGAERLLEQR